MQYALLIYTQEATEPMTAEAGTAQLEAYDAFTRHLTDRGALRAGEALHPADMSTTVRVRDGQTLTTDGPFAETKEVLGGFYLVEAADLDEAIGYAALIPGASYGAIEVRPIVDFSDTSAQAATAAAAAN